MFSYNAASTLLAVCLLSGQISSQEANRMGKAPPRQDTGSVTAVERLPAEVMSREICGQNCLYILLRLYGRPAAYDQVQRRLGATSEGVTLLELRDAARQFGLNAEVRRWALNDLAKCGKPVLTLMRQSSESQDALGHYIVIYTIEDGQLRFFDGWVTQLLHYPQDLFEERWTGLVLEPVAAVSAVERGALIAFACFWGLCLVAWLSRQVVSRAKGRLER